MRSVSRTVLAVSRKTSVFKAALASYETDQTRIVVCVLGAVPMWLVTWGEDVHESV